MTRRLLFAAAGCLALGGGAGADPVLFLDGPAAYPPGGSFQVAVGLAGAENLALYNVELVLDSAEGTPGSDFRFVAAAEPASRYVFAGEANDGFAYAILSDSRYRVTLSDLLITGSVTTTAGVNDLIAEVTVVTSPAMTADLVVGVAGESLELDLPGGGTIDGFEALQSSPPTLAIPIPEPACASLLAAGLIAARLRSRRTAKRIPALRTGGTQ